MSFVIVISCQENEVFGRGFNSPARVGGLSVLEDQTGRHLLSHPVPTGLVKAHSKPVALELECFGQKKKDSVDWISTTHPPLVVKFSQQETCLLQGRRGPRPVSTSWRFGRQIVRQ